MRSALLLFLILIVVKNLVGQNAAIQNKIFGEINFLRKNPTDYYKRYKLLFDKDKNAANFFRYAIPVPPLTWADNLLRAAKDESISNYKGNTEKYTSSYCGSAAFGGSSSTDDTTILNIVFENYTTLLSTDYHQIGIYAERKKEVYGKNSYEMLTTYSFVGTNCKASKTTYTFPGKVVFVDSSMVDFKKLNTAKSAIYLTNNEKRMIIEINFARQYPKVYAQIISNWLIAQKENLTYNDYIAGQEIINQLNNMKPLNCLMPDQIIYNAAKKHGLDMLKRGYSGHTGSDNSSPFDRIKKELKNSYIDGSENLVGGGGPRQGVITLLIDGGIGSRGHRENVLNPTWTNVACYEVGTIGSMPSNYVQNFAKSK